MKRWRERRGDVPEPRRPLARCTAPTSGGDRQGAKQSASFAALEPLHRSFAGPGRTWLTDSPQPGLDQRRKVNREVRPPAPCAAAILLDRGDRGRRRGGSCPRKTPAATAAAVAPEAGALVSPHVAPPLGSGPATRRRWASPPASPHHTAPMPKLRTHLLEERRRRGLESAAAGRSGQQAKPTKELAWVRKGIAAAPGQLMQAAAAHSLPLLLPPPLLSATWSTSSCVHFSQCTSTPYQRHYVATLEAASAHLTG